MTLTLSDFDYHLPDELIAQHPPEKRGQSRLLHIGKPSQITPFVDLQFNDLPTLVRKGDLLIFNNTKVIKARLFAKKQSGGKVEIMIERVIDETVALAMLKASHAPKVGSVMHINNISVQVQARDGMMYALKFIDQQAPQRTVLDIIELCGQLPLPPYITHSPTCEDEQRYQTIFAVHPGAVAAPTAGLHFTDVLMEHIKEKGVHTAAVTLHVGAGTFQPVKVNNITEHSMHSERFSIPQETIEAIQTARTNGHRVIAVGTTSLRALESWAAGKLGNTDIFITPGFEFNVVDCLITNFHLPKSTLLMLVSAFAGLNTIQKAYEHAVQQHYRFFSYGDAMWLER